jgi:TPP-dependent indolepyruvate ferredoxin oxidoreductase alpha subunit
MLVILANSTNEMTGRQPPHALALGHRQSREIEMREMRAA